MSVGPLCVWWFHWISQHCCCRWMSSYVHQCCMSGMKGEITVPWEHWVSLGMKILAFLKGVFLNFHVKSQSQKKPHLHCFASFPSLTLQDPHNNGLVGNRSAKALWFPTPPKASHTLFHYGSEPLATELPRVLKNCKQSEQKPVLSHEAPCVSAVLGWRAWPKYPQVRGLPYKGSGAERIRPGFGTLRRNPNF